jgi:hypothetical protein
VRWRYRSGRPAGAATNPTGRPATGLVLFSALLALAEELGRSASIFPTHDEHLNALAQGRDDLGDRFLYPFPSWDGLGPIQSKRHQLEAANRLD